MMQQYDSKLFFGKELGPLSEVISKIVGFIDAPPREPTDIIDMVEYINTQLPANIFLEATYPCRDCKPDEMIAHLTLLDHSDDKMSADSILHIIQFANYIGYANVLGQLKLNYDEPQFYTRHYVYQ